MKNLAIVGAESHTRDNAPWTDEGYDIWTFADWGPKDWVKRCDGLIEMHRPTGDSGYTEHPRSPEYWEWLQETELPVYMYPADPRIKNSIQYPLEDVLGMLDHTKTKGRDLQPLNSSLAYALALGIFKKYAQIDVYGVELAHSSEYRSQQPIFTFWIGFAAGRRINLNIECTEGLFIQPLYGIEESYNNDRVHQFIEEVEKQRQEALHVQWAADGALQALRGLLK